MQCGGARHLSEIPYAAWALAIVVVFTSLNLCGVQASAKVNGFLALGMSVVVFVFLAYAFHYIATVMRPVGGAWLRPFYDPATFAPGTLSTRNLDCGPHLYRLRWHLHDVGGG